MDGLMIDRVAESETVHRLHEYFQSFGFKSGTELDQLTRRVLLGLDAKEGPADIVVEQVRQKVEVWFATVLGLGITVPGAVEAAGRAAFLLSGAARRWPQAFLSVAEPPAEMVRALRRTAPPPVPHATIAMPEQSLVVVGSLGSVLQLLRKPVPNVPQ